MKKPPFEGAFCVYFTYSTVTTQVSDFVGSDTLVPVMVAVPAATPVTTPLADTVAVAGVADSQVTACTAAAGDTDASRLVTLPTATVAVAGVTLTEVTAIGVGSTITLSRPPGRPVALAVSE